MDSPSVSPHDASRAQCSLASEIGNGRLTYDAPSGLSSPCSMGLGLASSKHNVLRNPSTPQYCVTFLLRHPTRLDMAQPPRPLFALTTSPTTYRRLALLSHAS